MALIKDRKVTPDGWQLLERGTDSVAPRISETGDVIVDLKLWRESRERLIARSGRAGVWLDGGADPAEIASDLQHLALVAVRFESFTDGRGYSIGRLLRERYGWRGEMRAIGDVQRDQLYYLARCGFDAFALREGADAEAALKGFSDFTEAYQAAADQPSPLFRRREMSSRVL